jgi:hypothetical protein
MPIGNLTVDLAGGRLELPAGGVALRGCRLVDVDCSGQEVAVFKSFGSVFERCDFAAVRFAAGSMSAGAVRTTWRRCTFLRSDLRGVLPGTARFEDCRFEDARLEGWICRNADFVGCTFAGTLREVVFSGRALRTTVGSPAGGGADGPNDFRGNDFSAAVLEGVELVRGIDLSQQLLPGGPEYVRVADAPASVDRATRAVDAWPDGHEREAARRMLRSFAVRGYEDQSEIFARRDAPAGVPESVRERVWSLLLGDA